MDDILTALIKQLARRGQVRGYVTYEELNDLLPADQVSSEQIEQAMTLLSEHGIDVVEGEKSQDKRQIEIQCSFCSRSVPEIPKEQFVAGAKVFICRSCTELCVTIFSGLDGEWRQKIIQELTASSAGEVTP